MRLGAPKQGPRGGVTGVAGRRGACDLSMAGGLILDTTLPH